jgi:hypothetical protein
VPHASDAPGRRQLSLAHLTVLDTTPPELVTVAAAAGFRAIGIPERAALERAKRAYRALADVAGA